MNTLQNIQAILGVRPDSIWGPVSQHALNTQIHLTVESNPTLIKIQRELEVDGNGVWDLTSQGALNALIDAHHQIGYEASSFADPADVKAFNHCKAQGNSDLHCFSVGDNGIGEFGKITAQDAISMVAVNHDDMVAKWGSVVGSAHRPVEVTVNGKVFNATVEDRISAPHRIDLNPACAKLAGLQPPFLVPCTWKWLT